MVNQEELILQAKLELARRDFFEYCHMMDHKFYKRDRKYLVDFCRDLQEFLEGDKDVMIINMPPRHGKSYTAGRLVQWMLGNDHTKKVMTGSYNELLSTNFAKTVRNTIQEEKADKGKIVYSDIFPDTKVKKGDGSQNLWSLEGSYNNYLATSPGGSATGFGASIIIVDDLVKNAEEAYNEAALDKQFDWFANTMISRLEENGKIILIMTRWSSLDLAGRMINFCEEQNMKYTHINMQAIQKDGSMLCEDVLSKRSCDIKRKLMGEDIFSANFQQEPIDSKNCLYTSISTYFEVPTDTHGNGLFEGIYSYTDTADEGDDYLCQIVWGEYNKKAYILDVYYTQEHMEITEPEAARRLNEFDVNVAKIESNNGGRAFARNVRRILEEKYLGNHTVVHWFHQSKNKEARMLSNATYVMNNILFPSNWRDLFPDFYKDIIRFQRVGNVHDDCADCLTGVAENTGKMRNLRYDKSIYQKGKATIRLADYRDPRNRRNREAIF